MFTILQMSGVSDETEAGNRKIYLKKVYWEMLLIPRNQVGEFIFRDLLYEHHCHKKYYCKYTILYHI